MNRAFAGQAQVDGLALPRAEIEFEEVVVFFDLPIAEGQGIAGALSQIVVARRIGQVQVDVVQRRIRQLHQPGAVCRGVFGQVLQINFQPEGRTRITRIQRVFGVELEQTRVGDDIAQRRLAPHIFEDLHHSAQGQALGGFVELDGAGQHR